VAPHPPHDVTALDEAEVTGERQRPDALLSVVIPLYDGAGTIEATLESILRQTLPGIEIIVVDDGSHDGGPELARALGIAVTAQEHLGVAVARNRGLAAARGRWVAFLDQDDLWHPEHAERAIRWLDGHPGESIVFLGEVPFSRRSEAERLHSMDELVGSWAHHLVGDRGELDELIAAAPMTDADVSVTHHDAAAMLRGPISVTTSFIADPQLLRLAGGFAPHALAMDDYWLLVNVARLHPIAQLDQKTVFYRVHASATSRTTRLGLPFLSSAVALRLGGGIVDADVGLREDTAGRLHDHLLGELLASTGYRDRRFRTVVGDLAEILWPDGGRRRARRRALLATRMPWLRTLRARLRGARA
jgi:glycosyltransferase involved in cell wall biosynthesis